MKKIEKKTTRLNLQRFDEGGETPATLEEITDVLTELEGSATYVAGLNQLIASDKKSKSEAAKLNAKIAKLTGSEKTLTAERDALLQPNLSDEDVAEATEYIEGLAARLGVSPERIRTPVAYPIRQLALFYALMVCARNASDMTSGRNMQSGDDPYEKKRVIYEREYRRWEARISAQTFTGAEGKDLGENFPLTAKVGRG